MVRLRYIDILDLLTFYLPVFDWILIKHLTNLIESDNWQNILTDSSQTIEQQFGIGNWYLASFLADNWHQNISHLVLRKTAGVLWFGC